jgi:hypothetical protein
MDSMQGFGLNSQPVARREGDEKRRMIGDDSASWRGDRRRRGWNDSISGAWLLVSGVKKYLDHIGLLVARLRKNRWATTISRKMEMGIQLQGGLRIYKRRGMRVTATPVYLSAGKVLCNEIYPSGLELSSRY